MLINKQTNLEENLINFLENEESSKGKDSMNVGIHKGKGALKPVLNL